VATVWKFLTKLLDLVVHNVAALDIPEERAAQQGGLVRHRIHTMPSVSVAPPP
jgi:hypothetical protein